MNTWQKTSMAVGALVLAGSLTWGSIAYAQTATPTDDTTTQTPLAQRNHPGGISGFLQRFGGEIGSRFGGRMGRVGGGPMREDRDAILAEALGMTTAEVQTALKAGQTPLEIAQAKGMDQTAFQAALKAAAEKHLAAAVKAGAITQAQADAILARMGNGMPFFGEGPGGRRGGPMNGPGAELFGERDAILAEALGMTTAEVQTALKAGQTPLEIAQAKGMDQTAFQAALKAAAEKHLAAEVKAGAITQAQADAMLARMGNGMPFFGEGPGGRRGGPMNGPGAELFGERDAILAEALGMTTAEVQTALKAGQTPLQIAQAKGMDQTTFQAALKTATEKHLADAVKSGAITQAQADAMLERMGNGGPFFGEGPGGRHGGPDGGRHGGPRGGQHRGPRGGEQNGQPDNGSNWQPQSPLNESNGQSA